MLLFYIRLGNSSFYWVWALGVGFGRNQKSICWAWQYSPIHQELPWTQQVYLDIGTTESIKIVKLSETFGFIVFVVPSPGRNFQFSRMGCAFCSDSRRFTNCPPGKSTDLYVRMNSAQVGSCSWKLALKFHSSGPVRLMQRCWKSTNARCVMRYHCCPTDLSFIPVL